MALMMLGILTLAACNDDMPEQGPGTKPEVRPDTIRKTVIVYMVAENNLSSYAASDILEIKKGISDLPHDCDLVIYLDDYAGPRLLLPTAEDPNRSEKLPDDNLDSADPEQFYQNLRNIITRFPAETYSLVLWSHASGWIPEKRKRSFGYDENSHTTRIETELNISDMREQLEKLTEEGVHFDYLFFDACHMQCVESCYELRGVTDYIIASPAEIPGEGAPYEKIMKGLCMDGEDAVREIIEQYYTTQDKQSELYPGCAGVVISATKSSEMENLLDSTRTLLPDFYTQAYSLATNDIQAYAPFCWKTKYRPEYFDLCSTVSKLLSQEDYERWQRQVDRTIIHRRYTSSWMSEFTYFFNPRIMDPEHIAACSIFVPNTKYDLEATYNNDIRETSWYKDYNK